MDRRNRFAAAYIVRYSYCSESHWSAGPVSQKLTTRIQSARLARIWAVEESRGYGALEYVYVLAPTAFRHKIGVTKYREPNDPETEIWRPCQRFSTAVAPGRPLLGAE